MPPKNTNAAVERPFNLTETEVNITIHACKLLIQEGKVDKNALAEATGKDNPDTARRMWTTIKSKMGINMSSITVDSGTAVDGVTNPGPATHKPAAKRKSGDASTKKGGSKRAKKGNVEQQEEEVGSVEEAGEMKVEEEEGQEDNDAV